MNLEEIYAFLNKTQDGGPVAKALEAVIKAKDEDIKAKDKNIRALNTKVKDAEGKVKPLEEKIAVFADVLGVDEDAEDLQAAVADALKAKGGTGDNAAAERKIKRLEKQIADLNTKNSEEREKRHRSMVDTALLEALNKNNAIDASTMLPMFRGNVKVNDDETLTYGDDGATIEEGIKDWLDKNPTFVKNVQKGGAGGGTGGAGGKDGDMSDFAKELAKEAKGGQPDDKALGAYFE